MNLFFIKQAIKVFSEKTYTEDELRVIYDYLITIDNDILKMYINNDENIKLYLEALYLIIKIYEHIEDYENCVLLKKRIDETITLLK